MEAVKIPQAENRLAIVKMLLDAGVNLRAHDAQGNYGAAPCRHLRF